MERVPDNSLYGSVPVAALFLLLSYTPAQSRFVLFPKALPSIVYFSTALLAVQTVRGVNGLYVNNYSWGPNKHVTLISPKTYLLYISLQNNVCPIFVFYLY